MLLVSESFDSVDQAETVYRTTYYQLIKTDIYLTKFIILLKCPYSFKLYKIIHLLFIVNCLKCTDKETAVDRDEDVETNGRNDQAGQSKE